MPRKPAYRPTRGVVRKGPSVTREMRDAATAPKVRYFKPRRALKKAGAPETSHGIPIANATLGYNFARDRSLTDQITGLPLSFTRSSPAWHFDNNGLLVSAANDVARFDHDLNGVSLGLLMEGSSTNVALWSRTLAQSAWVKTNASVLKNQLGIDGAVGSASSMTATAANATVLQTVASTVVDHTFSVYLKRLTGTGQVNITVDDGVTWQSVSLTNVYQRFETTKTVAPVFGIQITVNGDSIAMDLAQVEVSSFSTSPIITAAATVSHAVDVCQTTDLSWYNEAGGTYYVRASQVGSPALAEIIRIDNNADRAVSLRQNSIVPSAITVDSGFNTLNLTGSGRAPGVSFRMALALLNNDAQLYQDGVDEGAFILVDMPISVSSTTLRIGNGVANANTYTGHIQEFAYSPVRHDNAFLQSITAP